LAIAVVYPRELRTTSFAKLPAALNAAVLEFMVHTENGPGDWRSGGVDAILEELRRAHDTIVRDDAVTRAVQKLSLGMAAVANSLTSSSAVCDRLRAQIDSAIASVLGLPSISPLRSLLAHEPVVCNMPLWEGGAPASAVETPEQFELLLPDRQAA
jgi:hypothetical protein